MSNPASGLNRKLHWFLLSYMVPVPGAWRPVSFFGSYTQKALTLPALKALREANQLPDSAVLTSTSYLGYMSTHKMRGTTADIEPTKMTEAFRQGMLCAMTSKDRPEPPTNPYEYTAQHSKESADMAKEWDAGFAEGVQQRGLIAQLNPAPVV